MSGKMDLLDQKIDTSMDRLSEAVHGLTVEMRATVRWLVVALVGASLSAEALRIVASAIMKGTP